MAEELSRLSQRLEALERQARELVLDVVQLRAELARLSAAGAEKGATVAERAQPPHVEPRAAESLAPAPARAADTADRSSARPAQRRLVDIEFWLGGRGLLLLGVLALVFAVAFFVKEAIERGWIGPAARVLAGAAIGMVAAVSGERIRAAGYRTYGLWLAAGGFSALYLSVWAAAAFYTLIPSGLAFALMVAVVAVAALLGLLHGSQSFVALAVFGGYLAPILLRVGDAPTVVSLGYIALLTGAGLWAASRAGWPYLALLAISGGALLTVLGEGDPHLHGVYLAALLAATAWVGRRREWVTLSLLAILLVWSAFWAGSSRWELSGFSFAAYAGAFWLAGLIASLGVSDWANPAAGAPLRGRRDVLELIGLAATALPPWFFFFSALAGVGEAWHDRAALVLGAGLGAVYIVHAEIGPVGRGTAHRAWRAGLGYLFWLVTPQVIWTGVSLVRAWLLEAIVFSSAGIRFKRIAGRAAGLVGFALAAVLFWEAALQRPQADAAFYSLWALTGLGTALGLAAWPLAIKGHWAARWEKSLRPILLLAAAIVFLAWGTEEIHRFYRLLGEETRWSLARDLTISGFWMAYAAALLATGFRLEQAPVRWVGLAMALIVAAKVFLYDLSQLARLYRIGSFVLLAVVLLALSFRYQKLRQGSGTDPG